MEPFQEYNRGKLGFISCDSGKHFADKVAKSLDGFVLKNTIETVFSNTEVKTEIDECIRNQDIYIFQDVQNNVNMSVNDNFMALKTAIHAAKLSNAHCITAVIPVFPYARQDKPKSRESITASVAARELEDCGAGRIITLDIHNEAIAGFFRKATLENLRASKSLIDYVETNIGTENLVVVAPDTGGADRANYFAKKLGTNLAMLYKSRDYSVPNKVEKMDLLGDVKGKNVFVIDDIIDTGGTLVKAAETLKVNGAKSVYFGSSLPLFSGPAVSRMNKAYSEGLFDKIIGTNVVYKPSSFMKENPWYREVNLENYFANVIYNINKGKSISKLIE